MSSLGRFTLFPKVIKSLIVINIIVFLVGYLFLPAYHIGQYSLKDFFAAYFYLQPLGDGFRFYPWQLITYQFIHGGFMHIIFNLFALWMFGAELENLWGGKKFLIFYLLCGIGAGLVQLFIAPMFGTPGPTIGASGSIYGVLLAFGLTFPDRPIFMFPFFIPIPAKFFVVLYAVLALIMGLSGSDGVAHFAHLGGAATGLLLLKVAEPLGFYKLIDRIFSRKKKFAQYNDYQEARVYHTNWESAKAHKVNEEKEHRTSSLNVNGEEITQAKIDEILDKITESGYQNLTEREKRILFELSQKLK